MSISSWTPSSSCLGGVDYPLHRTLERIGQRSASRYVKPACCGMLLRYTAHHMRTLDDILPQLRDLLPDLRRRYPIRSMKVFGSYARGDQREDSDLDLLIELGEGVDLIGYAGLQIELSDALGVPVDLVEWEALRPRLAAQVLSEVVSL